MRHIWNFVTSRVFITIFAIVIEVIVLLTFLYWISIGWLATGVVLYIFGLVMMFVAVFRPNNPAYKIAWAMVIIMVPLAGGVLYLIFGNKNKTSAMNEYFDHMKRYDYKFIPNLPEDIEKHVDDEVSLKIVNQVYNNSNQPAYLNTKTQFLSPGEQKFEKMLEDLKAAKKFIFLEYFIITPGIMWSKIIEILVKKAKEGLDVRLIYDDFGTMSSLPKNYYLMLRKAGIRTCIFNPVRARLDALMNNRDHRKILCIDGNIAYTGGINLADEYINERERFGYWKDSSIRLYGEGARGLTILFLRMWHYLTGDQEDYSPFLPTSEEFCGSGVVLPFGDNPVSINRLSETVYFQIINNASKYVYIQTPYLVMDNELTTALSVAAESGVDVRIVCPAIPDKFYVHALTRGSYKELIKAGVKIYEFTPGFIHSKVILSDDTNGVVGTANFDFRSLYLHFECGVWMYKTSCLKDIHGDFEDVFKKSKLITMEDCDNRSKFQKVLNFILKPFSPMM